MSFLAPFFLLGALAVGLPVIFHLIRRTTRRQATFSSLMFLTPSPPRLTRRSRLEHLLLLLLRCLVLCLLGLAFARPFIKEAVSASAATAGKRIVVLVDTSASMRRADLWSDARNKVESVLRQTSPADQVAIFTFARQMQPLVSFEQWRAAAAGERVALARHALADTSPGWSSTHLGNALTGAADLLAGNGGKSSASLREIVLVSDLQQGSLLDQLQGYVWPKGIVLRVERLQPRHPGNAAVQLVTGSAESGSRSGGAVRVRVSNAADSRRQQFQVGWAAAEGGYLGKPLGVYVPPGQSRIVSLATPAATASANRIILRGDNENFDDTTFVTPPELLQLNVLYFGNESPNDPRQPLYFLERACQQTGRRDVRVMVDSPAAALPPGAASAATLFVVTDALPENRAESLHRDIAAGKMLLFALRNAAAAPTLATLCGVDRVPVTEVHPANYAMLSEIDFQHPIFAPFADPRFSDFTKIHFWRYRRVDTAALPHARVVARFDSGDPAVLDVPVGKGRVLVLTSGWQPDDSQLALSTKFVPLLYATLDYSGAAAPPPLQYFIGDRIQLASVVGAGKSPSAIRLPDGSQVKLASGQKDFSNTATPGIYTVTSAGPAVEFAVNLNAAESRTAPLPLDELESLGAPMARPASEVARQAERKVWLQDAALENRQKLWRWLLLAALAVLLFETWLAGRATRRLTPQAEAAT